MLLTNGANVFVNAANVTIRRVKLQGGTISNLNGPCFNGMTVEDTTIEPKPGNAFVNASNGVIGVGGYTARRVKLWHVGEGFRASGTSLGCGPVTIEDSFALIDNGTNAGGECTHTDGLQGYDANRLTVRNTTIDQRPVTCGTSPFFYPTGQNNPPSGGVTIDRFLIAGGGFSFVLGTYPASHVSGLKLVTNSWAYNPIDVRCSGVASWDADIVTVDSAYQPTTVRQQPCNT